MQRVTVNWGRTVRSEANLGVDIVKALLGRPSVLSLNMYTAACLISVFFTNNVENGQVGCYWRSVVEV